jgi:Skp family chaperone for outer membrane proteins
LKLPKKLLTAALLVASLFMTGCGSQINIGYVDGEKIMKDAPQIKAVIEEGKKKAEEIQQEAMTTLESNPNWTDEEKAKALGELQRKLQGINQAYATQLKYKFDEAISDIAQTKKLDVVVDSSENQKIILMGGVDVTNEVIQKLQ